MLSSALVLLRACQFAAALVLFGSMTFLMLLRRHCPAADAGTAHSSKSYRRLVAWTLGFALVTLLAWLILKTRVMGGALSMSMLATVAGDTRFGKITLWRLGLMVLMGALLARPGHRYRFDVAAAIVAGVGLALLVWMGHVAAAADASAWQIAAQAAHLLALGAWIGGLPAFLWFLQRSQAGIEPLPQAVAITAAFSRLCSLSVVVVVVSGVMNTVYMLTAPADLVESTYGGILLAKLVVLAVLLGFAADNLLRQRPWLARVVAVSAPGHVAAATPLRALRRNVIAEIGLAAVILVLVAVLGMSSPPA